jgi:hypothetical protein
MELKSMTKIRRLFSMALRCQRKILNVIRSILIEHSQIELINLWFVTKKVECKSINTTMMRIITYIIPNQPLPEKLIFPEIFEPKCSMKNQSRNQ